MYVEFQVRQAGLCYSCTVWTPLNNPGIYSYSSLSSNLFMLFHAPMKGNPKDYFAYPNLQDNCGHDLNPSPLHFRSLVWELQTYAP